MTGKVAAYLLLVHGTSRRWPVTSLATTGEAFGIARHIPHDLLDAEVLDITSLPTSLSASSTEPKNLKADDQLHILNRKEGGLGWRGLAMRSATISPQAGATPSSSAATPSTASTDSCRGTSRPPHHLQKLADAYGSGSRSE